MKKEQDAQGVIELTKSPPVNIRIASGSSGCQPDNNPARPKKERGRVRFKNKTDATIVLTFEREIFTEKGNPYAVGAGKDETYHIDESVVEVGDEVEYSIDGSGCQEDKSTTQDVQMLAAVRSPRMIIE